MEQLSLLAIVAGLATGVVVSGLAGAALGLGFAVDVSREAEDQGLDPMDEEADRLFDEAFESVGHNNGFIFQMLVLSVVASLASGAVTAWLAPAAALANAVFVGTVGTILGLLSGRGTTMPRALLWLGALTTLPATLAGAWFAA